MALIASLSAAYASVWMSRLYAGLLKGSPMPKLTDVIIWRGGIYYWLIIPVIITALYVIGEKIECSQRKQHITEVIIIVSAITTSVCLIGVVLPFTRIIVALSE